jgi:hypothetical protein
MGVSLGMCRGRNRRGEPCGMPPLAESAHCWAHDPARARDRAAARKEGGRRRQAAAAAGPDEPRAPVPLRDVGSVQAQLERAVADTLVQPNGAPRSRTLGYLLGIALRAIEVGELEERLAAVEQRLGAGAAPARGGGRL